MLADLLKAVVNLVDEKNNEKNKNLAPVKFNLPELKNKVFFVHKGEIQEREVDHPDRMESVCSIDSFIDLLGNNEASEPDADKRIAVWLVDGQAKAVLDNNEYRRNIATLELVRMPLFEKVEQMGSDYGLRLKQDDMIRFLRMDLRESPDRDAVLLAVKSVKFATGETTQATKNQHDDTLGVSVHQAVTFENADMPETMRISTPVYFDPKNESESHLFEIMLDVDIPNKQFVMRVPKDKVDRAIYEELDTIKESITSKFSRVPVYFSGDFG